MPTAVVTNELGVDFFAAYDAISASLPENPAHPHEYGKRLHGNDGSEWIFGKVAASATVDRGNCVTIGVTNDDVIPSLRGTGSAIRGRRPAWYQGTTQLTAGMAAWFMISGSPQMKVAGQAALPFIALYTTDTSGVLSTVTLSTSQFAIRGSHLVVTQSGSTASVVQGIATFPTIGPLVDAGGV